MAYVFLKEEKIYYKLVCYTLYLGVVNRQKSRWKAIIYADKDPGFSEKGLALG